MRAFAGTFLRHFSTNSGFYDCALHRVPLTCTAILQHQIKFIEQQRARGASYRLLKHKINNYYMYTLYAKNEKKL